jgi:hypothetical protein
MSRRSRVVWLAIAIAWLANGVAIKATAGPDACKPVTVCEPVKAEPAIPACKPVKSLSIPEVCKPVKACDSATHTKYAVLQDRIVWIVSHFNKYGAGKEVYYDAPQSAPSRTPKTPATAPQSAAI